MGNPAYNEISVLLGKINALLGKSLQGKTQVIAAPEQRRKS
jgi:hypothetical protein